MREVLAYQMQSVCPAAMEETLAKTWPEDYLRRYHPL
jgi:hypothetical protein